MLVRLRFDSFAVLHMVVLRALEEVAAMGSRLEGYDLSIHRVVHLATGTRG